MTHNVPELVLVESISARNSQLNGMPDNKAVEILNKAKAVVFAVWQGKGTATTLQAANYYGVLEATVRQIVNVIKVSLS